MPSQYGETRETMKKLFALFCAICLMPSFSAHAWIGGPFSNNSFFGENGDDGVYEAVGFPTSGVSNGVGIFRWAVANNVVGITDDEQQMNRRESFNEMYYGHGKSYFVREHFKDHTRDITKSDGTLSVRGSMGTSHEPIITIVVSSFHKGDLAKNCRL